MKNLEDRIAQEKSRILYQQSRGVAVNSFLVAMLASLIFYDASIRRVLLGWLLANAVLLVIRFRVVQAYFRQGDADKLGNYRYWTRLLMLGSGLNGTLWGLLLWILFSDDVFRNSVLMVMHAGYISVASTATSAVVATFAAFTIPSSIMLSIAILTKGGVEYWPYLVLLIVAIAMFYGFAQRANTSLGEQIRLQLENNELLQHVRTERDRAEEAMQAKSGFLAAASHDLRQPVHALGLFAGSLEPHIATREGRTLLNRVRQSIDSLSSLFEGLLDISKLDAGVIENRPRHILLDTLCLKLYAEFLPLANGKGLRFVTECDRRPVAVYADPILLERVLRNLVSNAINYTDTGSVEMHVRSLGETIAIDVQDTGHGIASEDIPRIFGEYRQLENPDGDGQKGLGLGLSIVRRLSDLMALQLTVSSSVGKGSTFSLTLPHGDLAQVVHREQGHRMLASKNLTVLIIDDEKDILDGMRALFDAWGIDTLTASTIEQAVDGLQSVSSVGLVIADFRLGGNASGLDAIDRIREELNRDVPALLITGDTGPERLREATASGIHMLHKPVAPNDLIEQINAVLSPAVPSVSVIDTATRHSTSA